jgi:two-component system chemotaxis response regulator CheY
MAPMTGFELLKRVRASAHCSATPFLMVTAESGSGSIVAAGAEGVSAYLLKPYNAQSLKAKMDEVYAQTRGA